MWLTHGSGVMIKLQRGMPPEVVEDWFGIPKRTNDFRYLMVTGLPRRGAGMFYEEDFYKKKNTRMLQM